MPITGVVGIDPDVEGQIDSQVSMVGSRVWCRPPIAEVLTTGVAWRVPRSPMNHTYNNNPPSSRFLGAEEPPLPR
jgi:hypothetical protein